MGHHRKQLRVGHMEKIIQRRFRADFANGCIQITAFPAGRSGNMPLHYFGENRVQDHFSPCKEFRCFPIILGSLSKGFPARQKISKGFNKKAMVGEFFQ